MFPACNAVESRVMETERDNGPFIAVIGAMVLGAFLLFGWQWVSGLPEDCRQEFFASITDQPRVANPCWP